jgi:hypothetical protein
LVKFLFQNDILVDALHTARNGHELWVLYGARYPVILKHERNNSYSFINESLIWEEGMLSTIMFGEIVERAETKNAMVELYLV